MWYRYQPETLPLLNEEELIHSILKKDESGLLQTLLESTLQQVKSTSTSKEVTETVNKTNEDIQKVSQISTGEQKLLQSYVLQKLAKIHGTQAENITAVRMKEQLIPEERKTIEVDENYYQLELFVSPSYSYKIIGRIDRIEHNHINGESVLIEIKNRLNRLFYKVKEYEYIQIQIYLFLTGLQHAKLEEQLNDEIHMIDIPRNQSYIDHVIFPELMEFVHRLDNILSSPSARTEYLNRKQLMDVSISTSSSDF